MQVMRPPTCSKRSTGSSASHRIARGAMRARASREGWQSLKGGSREIHEQNFLVTIHTGIKRPPQIFACRTVHIRTRQGTNLQKPFRRPSSSSVPVWGASRSDSE